MFFQWLIYESNNSTIEMKVGRVASSDPLIFINKDPLITLPFNRSKLEIERMLHLTCSLVLFSISFKHIDIAVWTLHLISIVHNSLQSERNMNNHDEIVFFLFANKSPIVLLTADLAFCRSSEINFLCTNT